MGLIWTLTSCHCPPRRTSTAVVRSSALTLLPWKVASWSWRPITTAVPS